LKAEDIADAIAYCINAPKHVTISDMTIIRVLRQNREQSIENSLKIKV
jgi:NADP-dependent 3-hydroxy acid dehydrogenase YdfG